MYPKMRYGNDKPLTEKYVERAFKIYVLYRLSEHFTFQLHTAEYSLEITLFQKCPLVHWDF